MAEASLQFFCPSHRAPRALFSFSPVPLQHKDASVVETVAVLKSVPRVQTILQCD